MTGTYILNPNFVLRPDENIIFDSENFIIHKFNDEGMEIVNAVSKKAINIDNLTSSLSDFIEADIKEIVKLMLEKNILVDEDEIKQ